MQSPHDIGTSRSILDRDLLRRQVRDGSRDKERRYTRRSLRDEFAVLPLDHFESADAASNVDANSFRVFRRNMNRSLSRSIADSRHRELDEAPHFLHILSLDEVFWYKTLYFTGKSTRIGIGGEKGYRRYATSPAQNRPPGLFRPNANRADKPDASDHDGARPLLTKLFSHRIPSYRSWTVNIEARLGGK